MLFLVLSQSSFAQGKDNEIWEDKEGDPPSAFEAKREVVCAQFSMLDYTLEQKGYEIIFYGDSDAPGTTYVYYSIQFNHVIMLEQIDGNIACVLNNIQNPMFLKKYWRTQPEGMSARI